uniref:NADH-ubiquinone oxidoreductase chain 5 n=1 Tax=Xylocopa appendiculata TaxID=135683 RepID=A0A343DRE7_9HYME|nr:NADH dehydrogenase subunit 5 [Xylocopa appendiculata]
MLNMMVFGIMLYIISLLLMFLSLNMIFNVSIYIFEWEIYEFNSMKFNMIILVDDMTLLFMMLVSLISSLIMLYSMKYMNLNENDLKRFYYLLMLFIFSMYFMILSPNMLTIILGWDGLGLISFCLIVYYQNFKAMSAGLLTMILNRIGDASLLMIMGLMCMNGSWNLMLYNMDNLLLMMMILVSFTKSAQMPFSLWLPAAMMAPTPVSSLVHSSTLVTAGIYVMIRYSNLMSDEIKMKLMLISSFTMLMSGLYANYEIDFKKIIALSTLSQLGFMMSILFLGYKDLAFFHLYIHAMFKSLMFMCAGSYIHYNYSIQDVRDYSGMMSIYPIKGLIFIFTSLSLTGFPFLLGFFSKDLIMEEFFNNKLMMLNMMNLLLGTIFTVSYSTRLYLLLMYNKSVKFKYNMIMEDKMMNLVMFKLMMISLIYGKYYFMLLYSLYNINLSMILKLMLLKMLILGIMFGYFNYKNYNFSMNMISLMFKNMNYLNKFYNNSYMIFFNMIFKYELLIEKKILHLILNEYVNFMVNLLKFEYKMNYYLLMLSYLFMMMFMYLMI